MSNKTLKKKNFDCISLLQATIFSHN
jgi:hypothetical protein